MQYIVLIGAFQALVALWLIQFKERKSMSNYLFTSLLSAIAVHLGIKFIIFNFIPDESIRHQMNTFVGASYGPLIYLYTLSKTKNNFSISKKWFVFIPLFILMIGYLTISCVFFVLNRVDITLLNLYNNVSFWLLFTINSYYPIKSIIATRKHSTLEKSEYDVIRRISVCILMMEVGVIISQIFIFVFPGYDIIVNFSFRTFAYFLLLMISFLIIRKSISAENRTSVEKELFISEIKPSKEEKIDHQEINIIDYENKFAELWQKMDLTVQKNELFRDCDLNLDLLAAKTDINKYQISEMLNGYKNKPFYRYINEYRIDYFKNSVEQAMEKNENINFLSLAFDAGFKSKSSFNRYFKEIIGKTPSEYYKNSKQQNLEISA